VWILSGPLGAVDQDEAVVGLMGRHFRAGHISVFFWGQNYGGSQEAMATALVFAVLGAGRVALKIVPIAGYAVAAWLVWRIGRRTIGEPRAGIAAGVFLVGPAFFVLRSTRAYGFYAVAILVATAVLLAVLRLRERPSTLELAWVGFLVGMGWWATPQVVFVLVPALLWLAVRAPALVRRAHVALAGAIVGAAPWLLWSATHHWASLHSGIDVPGNTYSSHLRHFFNPLLPEALGLRVPYTAAWLPGVIVGTAVYVAVLVAFAGLLWKRPPQLELLLVVAAGYPLLYGLSPASFYTGEPRYLFLLSPVIALLVAWVAVTPPRQLACLALVTALSITGLLRIDSGDPYTPKAPLATVIAALDARGIDRVFAPYRIAHRLTFDSDERIIASSFDFVRWRPFDRSVRTSPLPAYVLLEGSPDQLRLATYLARAGGGGDEAPLGLYHLYVPQSRVLPEDWR